MKKLLATALAALAFAAHAQESLLERINNKGTIIVATDGAYPPFSYHDESGKLTGYDVEVTRLVGEKLGVAIDFKETLWDGMLAGLKAGRFDLVANQVTLHNDERRANFDAAEPYTWTGAMILIHKDSQHTINTLSDIKGLKAAQALNSNFATQASNAGAEIVPAESLPQELALVVQKRADLTMNDALAYLDYLRKNPDAPLKQGWRAPKEEQVPSGLVAAKGNGEALKKISAALIELREEGKLKALGEQFFGEDVSIR